MGVRLYHRSLLYFYFFHEKCSIFLWLVLGVTDIRLNCAHIILHLLAAAGSQNAVIHFQVPKLLAACLPDGERAASPWGRGWGKGGSSLQPPSCRDGQRASCRASPRPSAAGTGRSVRQIPLRGPLWRLFHSVLCDLRLL